MVVDLENRRKRKAFEESADKRHISTEYAKGAFIIKEIEEGGRVTLEKGGKDYKILMEYPKYKEYVEGEVIKCMLSKKMFYVYWDLEYTY